MPVAVVSATGVERSESVALALCALAVCGSCDSVAVVRAADVSRAMDSTIDTGDAKFVPVGLRELLHGREFRLDLDLVDDALKCASGAASILLIDARNGTRDQVENLAAQFARYCLRVERQPRLVVVVDEVDALPTATYLQSLLFIEPMSTLMESSEVIYRRIAWRGLMLRWSAGTAGTLAWRFWRQAFKR